MKASDFCSCLLGKLGARKDLDFQCRQLSYNAGNYAFFRVCSAKIQPHDRIVLIRAGIHGDETSGPLSLLRYFDEIFDYAHERNVKLIIYPLGNPSGFDAGSRYNMDGHRGEAGNNDFLRYCLGNSEVVDDIGPGRAFRRWYWLSDKNLRIDLTLETSLMHEFIQADPLGQIIGVVDLHQDYLSKEAGPGAYHYSFGDLSAYGDAVERIDRLIPVFRHKLIDAGQASAMRTDEQGFIVRHDGTLGDLFYRLGAKYCVTPETTGSTPIGKACEVNLIWIKKVIDLVAQPDSGRKRSYEEEVADRVRAIGASRIGSVAYNSDEYPLYAVNTPAAKPCFKRMFLSAGLHGEEPAAVYALLDFLEKDAPAYSDRMQFTAVPCANPWGFERNIRTNGLGFDLNRHFYHKSPAPECSLIQNFLRKRNTPYVMAADMHETETNYPPGEGFAAADNPDGFYLYETFFGRVKPLGGKVVNMLEKRSVFITPMKSIYGEKCAHGVITSPPMSHYRGTRNLDEYIQKYTNHVLTVETPTCLPLSKRISIHRRILNFLARTYY